MNYGLQQATQPIVLFLTNDNPRWDPVSLLPRRATGRTRKAKAVVGQVLQPGEHPRVLQARGVAAGLRADLEFPFL